MHGLREQTLKAEQRLPFGLQRHRVAKAARVVQQHKLAQIGPQGDPSSIHSRRIISINQDCNLDC